MAVKVTENRAKRRRQSKVPDSEDPSPPLIETHDSPRVLPTIGETPSLNTPSESVIPIRNSTYLRDLCLFVSKSQNPET